VQAKRYAAAGALGGSANFISILTADHHDVSPSSCINTPLSWTDSARRIMQRNCVWTSQKPGSKTFEKRHMLIASFVKKGCVPTQNLWDFLDQSFGCNYQSQL
jgi:hypothetical protein